MPRMQSRQLRSQKSWRNRANKFRVSLRTDNETDLIKQKSSGSFAAGGLFITR